MKDFASASSKMEPMDPFSASISGKNKNKFKKVAKLTATLAGVLNSAEEKRVNEKQFRLSDYFNPSDLLFWLIPFHPTHKFVKRTLMYYRNVTIAGTIWDMLQIIAAMITCGMYIAETYTYGNNKISWSITDDYYYSEQVITYFFLLDFLFTWFISQSTLIYFSKFMTYVDILTIIPVFLGYAVSRARAFSVLRFLRMLRLVRIGRLFKLLINLNAVHRQIVTLFLTLLSLTFVASGVIQVVENDLKQLTFKCQYISGKTLFEPSCSESKPSFDDPFCDCAKNNCIGSYVYGDKFGEPSLIKCQLLPYFDCFYFIIATISTVGYGDIAPSTNISRIVIILFILTSLIVVPWQLNQLSNVLSKHSVFRTAFSPRAHEDHVVLCGHVNDSKTLERFCREFFHPDRVLKDAPEYHIVVICPVEPCEEVRALLYSPQFDSRITYLVGSALNADDLIRARVDIALAVFFLCNTEAKYDAAIAEGSATVLRTLAVTDFNPDIQCLVEVLNKHDSDILKNSDVDVVLCVDEFKNVLMARNAVCPGLSTLVGNLLHTYGETPSVDYDHWLLEYNYGLGMDTYYIALDSKFLSAMHHEWQLICEAIFLTFQCILLGVVDTNTCTVFLNPHSTPINPKQNIYFAGIVLAPNQETVTIMSRQLADTDFIDQVINELCTEESKLSTRFVPQTDIAIVRSMSSKKPPNTSYNAASFKNILLQLKVNKTESTAREQMNNIETRNNTIGTPLFPPTAPKQTSFNEQKMTRRNIADKFRKIAVADKKMENRSQKGSNVGMETEKYNIPRIISQAHDLQNHIVVLGCGDNFMSFLEFALLPVSYHKREKHPIVFIGLEPPQKWKEIQGKYSDVYYIEGDVSTIETLLAANIAHAFSVVLLVRRTEELEFEMSENIDYEALFIFLKLLPHLSPTTNFMVELTSSKTMTVLNSSAVRQAAKAVNANNELNNIGHKVRNFDENSSWSETRRNNAKANNYIVEKSKLLHPHQRNGIFSSQYTFNVLEENKDKAFHIKNDKILTSNPGRRASAVVLQAKKEQPEEISWNKGRWESADAYYTLATYASGKVFVPDIVQNLLCQSFFASVTSNFCESIVCGSKDQVLHQIPVPRQFVTRYFKDIFRAFLSKNVLVVGIYRCINRQENALMPYVFTCPPKTAILRLEDKLFVYANPVHLKYAEEQLALPIKTIEGRDVIGVDDAVNVVHVKRRTLQPVQDTNVIHAAAAAAATAAMRNS